MNIESWERNYRNSSSQIFFKIGCSRKFHMKTPVLFLIKLQIWRLASSLRRDSKTRVMRKKLQKQSFADILQERFSYKFRNFHRKIPVLESLFNKVLGVNISGGCFWKEPCKGTSLVKILQSCHFNAFLELIKDASKRCPWRKEN